MLQAALEYIARGFAVFPLKPGEKVPHGTLVPNGVKDATRDADQIRRWWKESPNANVGVALGEVSGFFCVDLDDGATEEDLKTFPRTITTKTRDGYHLYFKMPAGGIKNGEFDLSKASGRASTAKANVRATHYYVVGVGSVVNGWEYTWHSDLGGELSPLEAQAADAPPWLLGAKNAVPSNTSQAPVAATPGVTPGSRHDKLKSMAVAARKKGKTMEQVSQELTKFNLEKCKPPKAADEIEKIVMWAFAQVETDVVDEGEPKNPGNSPYKLRETFVDDMMYRENGVCSIRYHRQEFFRSTGKNYKSMEDAAIENEINHWLIHVGKQYLAGKEVVNQIKKLLRLQPVFVDGDLDLPLMLNEGKWESGKHLIPFQNGLFDIREYALTGNLTLKPHTPDFFCNYVLPFDFDPKAQCPTFEKIANTAFDSSEKAKLWEEVMGIHLYQPFLLEHFFILQGEGGNGKGVLLAILKALLGRENVCSVPLESFHSDNFSFHQTYGKLANIVSDQHDIDNINEGVLKQFVSRELITFNRKFKDPITAEPTCFLTIATNSIPRFLDKTDGIWRRMVLFKFDKQIPVSERNPNFVSSKFWLSSGELPGIFNLALAGLMRVIARGRLAEVAEVEQSKADHRIAGDNVAGFIHECLTPSDTVQVSAMDVFAAYRIYAKDIQGTHPVASNKFHGRLAVELPKRGFNKALRPEKKFRMNSVSTQAWQYVQFSEFGLQTLGRDAICSEIKE